MKYIANDILIPAKDITDQNEKELIISKLRLSPNSIREFIINRKSLDSRFHKTKGIFYVYNVKFEYDGKIKNKKILSYKDNELHQIKHNFTKCTTKQRPIIIGAGPAGLFCALRLAEFGINSIILERGKDLSGRGKDIDKLMKEGTLNPESNVQFGLGGAGTYSDGKLRSRIKNEFTSYVLQKFIEHGANPSILYESKPHLGTDKLSEIIADIKKYLEDCGTEFKFSSKATGINSRNGKLVSIIVNNTTEIPCSEAILCIGNSARDTFQMLYDNGIHIEQKPIAVGVRIEHPQSTINKYVYGDYSNAPYLPNADYQLTHRDETGRSIYTFCNCPGGVVINSSSESNRLSVNGMSYSQRNKENANSALVVNVKNEDYNSTHPLAGIEFQRSIEEKSFFAGGCGYKAPVMRISDFISSSKSCSCIPTILPGYTYADINEIFPDFIGKSLKNTLKYFSGKIEGFDEGIITACETKTSTPLRITRDSESYESTSLKGLFPVGEGAGYAGGIISSAVDGVCCANRLIKKLNGE